MQLKERIQALAQLGRRMSAPDETLQAIIHRTYVHNNWFTLEHIQQSLDNIRDVFLQETALENWAKTYALTDTIVSQKVALVLAGNIPLVGFHDLLCVFIVGHRAQVKLSEKDKFLIPHLVKMMSEDFPGIAAYFEFTDKLREYDAVIATGSNNSSRYFESYFGKYPHIIRRNRNAVAVLNGAESKEELAALADDVLLYFGLGCRNVSKLYLPENYDFDPLLEALYKYKDFTLHNKYKNNFDYNYTLLILNKIPYKANACMLMIEDTSLQSRIASLHYEYYSDQAVLSKMLTDQQEEIQCIVSTETLAGLKTILPGQAQQPGLQDYADGVDTIQFLLGLEQAFA